jgi:hypothetical protein
MLRSVDSISGHPSALPALVPVATQQVCQARTNTPTRPADDAIDCSRGGLTTKFHADKAYCHA